MKITMKPVLAGLAGLAGVAALAPLAFSGAASAAPTPQGAPEIRSAGGAAVISSGDSADTWTLRLPAGAKCGGDAIAGYLIQGYVVAASADPATLQFNDEGVQPFTYGAPQSAVRVPLYDTFGSPYRAFPAAESGFITNIPDFSYDLWAAGDLPDGQYNVGIACTKAGGVEEFWNVQETFTTNSGDGAANFDWARGAAAVAPNLTGVTSAQGTCTATFTPGASDPAATSYTVRATPQGGGAAVTATGAGSPITVGGLTNFQAYDVVVTANNGVGESSASNSRACTPTFTRPAVTNLAAAVSGPGDTSATLTWTAPTGDVPTGYTVVVTGPTAGSYNTSATTLELENLALGNYSVTVTPVHATQPNGNPASATFAITPVYVPPVDKCANPQGLVSGLLNRLGLRALAVPVCRLGL